MNASSTTRKQNRFHRCFLFISRNFVMPT